ncbi:MAG: hypothetical protein ACI9OO_001065, partial [Bacteroidia bacterium]
DVKIKLIRVKWRLTELKITERKPLRYCFI